MSVAPCRNGHRCRAPSSVESSDIHGHLGVDVSVNGRCRRRSQYCWPGRTLARQSDDARPRTSLPCGFGWPVWIWVGGRVSAAGAGDESGHHGGEVPVEGSASAVVARGGARVGVRGGFLCVSDPNHQHLIAPRADHRSIRTDDEPITTDPASGVRPRTDGCFRCRRRESDGLENHATSDRRSPSQLDRKRSQCVASRTAWWSTQARSRFTPRRWLFGH